MAYFAYKNITAAANCSITPDVIFKVRVSIGYTYAKRAADLLNRMLGKHVAVISTLCRSVPQIQSLQL